MANVRLLPRALVDVWNWQDRAACRDLDTAMFFHTDSERGGPRRRREDRAKAVCAGCPVRVACFDHSVRVEEPYGIWGGVAEGERLLLLRARARNGPTTGP